MYLKTESCSGSSPPGRRGLDCSKILLFLILLCCSASVFAVSGILLNEDGAAISGANIRAGKKTARSSLDGSFRIEATADSIYISRIGYHPLVLSIKTISSPIILQRSEIILPTILVRAEQPQSPSLNASIISPDTNGSMQSSAELLLSNPSFSSTDVQLGGERQTVSLLGSFNRHSLVMLDGVVLNPSGEAFDFSTIPLAQISYIEIIKGNSSVYGGSAAIGGIIHLHSKSLASDSFPQLNLSAGAGAFGLRKQSYGASFGKDALTLSAEYSHQDARNDFFYDTPSFWNLEPELKRRHNRKTADSFWLKSGYRFKALELNYSLNLGSFVRELPGPINFLELYDASRLTGAYSRYSLKMLNSFRKTSSELILWRNSDSSSFSNLGSTNPFAASHYRQDQLDYGIKAGSSLFLEDSQLGMEAEFKRIGFSYKNLASQNASKGDRTDSALALRAKHHLYPSFGDYSISGAVRGDFSSGELHPTWRLEHELSLPVLDQLKLGAYLGTAFSQPSLFDMYWIGDSETMGNPELENESSLGYNLYAELGLDPFSLRIAWFQNWVDQLIQWRQYYLNGATWKPFNVGSAEISNLEMESNWEISTYLGLSGSVTFTEAIDQSLNPDGSPSPGYKKRLVYTPDLKAALKLSLGDDKRGFSLSYSYTGEQYSTVDNLIAPLPPFDLLDAALFYRISLPYFDLRLDLKANNLLDKRYDIYAYTPQPGFNWQTGISISTHHSNLRGNK